MSSKRGRYRKTSVEPHSGGYRYRRSVPSDLRDLLKLNTWIHWFGKVSPDEASARGHEFTARHTRQISALRALKPEERQEILTAGGIDAWITQADQNSKLLPFFAGAAGVGFSHDVSYCDPLAPEEVQDQQTLGVIKARRLYDRVKSEIDRTRAFKKRIEGEVEGAALLGLVDVWEKVRPPRSYKTVEKARLYVARFVDIVGDLSPREVSRVHAIKFRDVLHQQGMSAANVAAQLAKLNTLFNVALGENLVGLNPFQGVKAHKEVRKHSAGRQGFSGDQIKKILKQLSGEGDDFSWAVRLLIFQGARSGEIAQLRVDDVTSVHGVPVLRVHDRHGSVKNKASVRDIPIHPKCAGVVAFARAVEAKFGSEAWLFQSFETQKQGRAHKFQTYAGREFLRSKVGITQSCFTLHSLRHSFRTACREASVPEAVSRAIMGHSMGPGEHGAYGAPPSLKVRARWIAKVNPAAG